jgi:CheY-like chemotaxis protein
LLVRQRYLMALILAVDPEQRQHAALACLARELDGHELLSAASCADALTVLDRRSPDLVLLPVLLPQAEEGELLTRLRDQTGTDVPALTIPQLKLPDAATLWAPASTHPAWLNQILHPQDTTEQAGEECEPTVFADLIRSYLGPVHNVVADTASAVADAARAAAEKRRTHLVSAARATVTWVRNRRERWNDRPPVIAISAPPLDVPMPLPPPAPAPVPVPVRASVPVAVSVPAPPAAISAEHVEEILEFSPADVTSFEPIESFEPVETFEPLSEEEKGPGVVARALTVIGRLKEIRKPEALDSIGPAIVRWLPRAAVVAVVLTLGVTGRAYWLKTVSAPRVGVAVLESLPSGAQVMVDGQVMGLTPLTATLPSGTHRVDFKYRGKTRTIDVVVPQGGKASELVDWSPRTVGRLQVNSEPAGAHVLVDNVPRGVTPLTLDDVPLGTHVVMLQSNTGSVKRSVTIKSDEPATLTENIYAGWIKVLAPFDITIAEGSKLLRLDDRDQVMLSAGPHDIRFENRAFGFTETRHIEVQPGVTTPLSIAAPYTTLTLTTSAPAELLIDNVNVGKTPLIDYPVQIGTRDVQVKSAAGDRRLSVAATVKPVVVEVDFSKP